jgi:hypothetical protein
MRNKQIILKWDIIIIIVRARRLGLGIIMVQRARRPGITRARGRGYRPGSKVKDQEGFENDKVINLQ